MRDADHITKMLHHQTDRQADSVMNNPRLSCAARHKLRFRFHLGAPPPSFAFVFLPYVRSMPSSSPPRRLQMLSFTDHRRTAVRKDNLPYNFMLHSLLSHQGRRETITKIPCVLLCDNELSCYHMSSNAHGDEMFSFA